MKKYLSLAALVVALVAAGSLAREPIATAKVYTPRSAALDAYVRAEQARRHAIDRQRQAVDLITWYGTYSPGRYQIPPSYLAGRGQWRYERKLSKSPYALAFPNAPGYAYPGGGKVVPVLPYLDPTPPPVEQPSGHRKTWTGPNSYVYQPLYASDPNVDDTANPRGGPQEDSATAPVPIPSETIPTPPSLPEAIPTPRPQ